MTKNSLTKNILSVVAVIIFGFILLNLAFGLCALVYQLIELIFPFPKGQEINPSSLVFAIRPITFVILIAIISWLIFRSTLPTIYKAIYANVPFAVIMVISGIALYRWPIASYSIGTLISLSTLFYLYKTKKPWLYWVSVLFVSIALLIMAITGTDI